jgi:hypothetical protein
MMFFVDENKEKKDGGVEAIAQDMRQEMLGLTDGKEPIGNTFENSKSENENSGQAGSARSSFLDSIPPSLLDPLLSLPETMAYGQVTKNLDRIESESVRPLFATSKELIGDRKEIAEEIIQKYFPGMSFEFGLEMKFLIAFVVPPYLASQQANEFLLEREAMKKRGGENESN